MSMKTIMQLVLANVFGRAYLLVLTIFFSNIYHGEDLAEVLFFMSLLTFFATVGPLRLETSILNSRKPLGISSSYFFYCVLVCISAAGVFVGLNYWVSTLLMFCALHSNIGTSFLIRNGKEKVLANMRVWTSFLGIGFLFSSQRMSISLDLSFFVVMALYFFPGFYAIKSYVAKKTAGMHVLGMKEHLARYLPYVFEMFVVTFSNYGLIFLLKNNLPPLEYSQIAMASQIYISSAVMFGSTISSKYLNELNRTEGALRGVKNIYFSIFSLATAYAAVALLSPIVASTYSGMPILAAVAAFSELSVIAIAYVFVIPFSAIMIYEMRLKLNLSINVIGLICRLLPLMLMNFEQGFRWYICNSVLYYSVYGLVILSLHRRT